MPGEESSVSADSSYHGVEKQEETKDKKLDWLIAKMPSKVRVLKKHTRINKLPIQTEYIKASIRAKVEHPFRTLKCQFDSGKLFIKD